MSSNQVNKNIKHIALKYAYRLPCGQRKYRNFLGKDPRAASRPFYFLYKLHNILRCLKWKFKVIVHWIFMIPRYVIYSKSSSGENVRGTPRCPKLSLSGLSPIQPNHYFAPLFAVLNFSLKILECGFSISFYFAPWEV